MAGINSGQQKRTTSFDRNDVGNSIGQLDRPACLGAHCSTFKTVITAEILPSSPKTPYNFPPNGCQIVCSKSFVFF